MNRSDGVKELYFHQVDSESEVPNMHALVAVMGVIDPDNSEDPDLFMRTNIIGECDKYLLVWETQHLRRFGNTIKFYHHSSLQAERSSTAFPLAPMVCYIACW